MSCQSRWMQPTREALSELLDLKADWNSYGALPIQPEAVRHAMELLCLVMRPDAPAPQVVPTSCGGVQLEWHTGGFDIEVSIRPSGEAYACVEDLRTGEEWDGPLPERQVDLKAALGRLADRLANDPGWLTRMAAIEDEGCVSVGGWVHDIQQRATDARQADPEYAEMCERPLAADDPQHEILDRLRAGEFRQDA